MKGTVGLRLAAAAMSLMAALCVDTGVASAQGSAPYFSALPASAATELQTARYGAVAATLPDGRVLIAGGTGNSGVLQSAEVFNPTGDTFTPLPASGATELQSPRYAAVSAALPDGQVLIAGGYNSSSGILQSAELFNPATDSFTALPASGATQLEAPRAGAVAAALPDGQVLIAGGYNSSSGTLQSAELFNPATHSFTALPASGATELEAPRAGAVAATLPDGQVLIAGGGDPPGYEQDAELFNPSTDTFTTLPASGGTEPRSERAQGVGVVLPDGKVLITGGVGLPGVLQSAELYNSAPEAAVVGGNLGEQTVGQPSALQSLVLTNIGAQTLTVSGASLDGAGYPADFAIIADTCVGGTLTFKQSCTITVRFTPSAPGSETATIDLTDNEPTPSTITLSGTGLAQNSDPADPAGAIGAIGSTGPTNPTGATGPTSSQRGQGNPGQIELVTCPTVIETARLHGKKRTVTDQKCTRKLISGTSFNPTTAKATLTRQGVIYATGTARLTRLTLYARRPLRAGEYTLTLTRQPNHHRLQTQRQITIG